MDGFFFFLMGIPVTFILSAGWMVAYGQATWAYTWTSPRKAWSQGIVFGLICCSIWPLGLVLCFCMTEFASNGWGWDATLNERNDG